MFCSQLGGIISRPPYSKLNSFFVDADDAELHFMHEVAIAADKKILRHDGLYPTRKSSWPLSMFLPETLDFQVGSLAKCYNDVITADHDDRKDQGQLPFARHAALLIR